MRSHMQVPIYIPRWVLTVKYALFIVLGLAVLWTTAPSLQVVTGDPYTQGWSGCVIVAATCALVGSTQKKLERLEKWSAAGLACLFIVYALSPIILVLQGDADRAAYSVVALIVSLLPTARALQLLNRPSNG